MARRLAIAVCILCAALASAETALAAAPYVFSPLLPVGADTASYGIAVNRIGGAPVVAGSDNSVGNLNRGLAMTWANGTATQIQNLTGMTYGKPFGIDGSGNMVGYATSATAGTEKYPWYLAAGGSAVTYLPYTNPYTIAYGMNDLGRVVGFDDTLAGSGSTGSAVLWTKTGGVWGEAALPGLVDGAYSSARGISSNGIVAGWSNTVAGTIAIGNPGYQDATTWRYNTITSTWMATDKTSNHNAWDPGTNPKGCYGASAALAVNNSGLATGWAHLLDPINQGPNPSPVVFEPDGTIVRLAATATAGDQSNAINDSGVVVGQSQGKAFTWDAVNGLRDLNVLYSGIIPTGWALDSAMGIDNAGDITGYALAPDGMRGFRLSPAMPGDANADGKVDINDLSRVLTNYDRTGVSWAEGDFNNDGKVDINDLSIVLTNYDHSLGSSAGAISAVPEPSSMALLAGITAVALLYYRRRRGWPAFPTKL